MATIARAFVLQARAKFNVRLDVGGTRPDGLHEIGSIVADLSIADEVLFAPAAHGFSVTIDDPTIAETDNLAYRAAKALNAPLPPMSVHIKKTVPSRAGLGGGSADAAAMLRGLASVAAETGLVFTADALLAAAKSTGADVAACLTPGVKIVEGSGDVVRAARLTAPPFGVLLLKPGVGVETAQGYRLLDQSRSKPPDLSASAQQRRSLLQALERGDFAGVCALAHNDFQGVIEAAYPPVLDARRRLSEAGAAAALLCGSGSCVAGLFPTVAAANTALERLDRNPSDWAAATGFADGG